MVTKVGHSDANPGPAWILSDCGILKHESDRINPLAMVARMYQFEFQSTDIQLVRNWFFEFNWHLDLVIWSFPIDS